MQGQQVNIDIKAPVDTETFDLISSDTIYSKKNALVYKGVLSNTTKTTGVGTVTTQGKSLIVDGTTVKIDDTELDYSGKKILNGDSMTAGNEVVHARTINDTVHYIERLSPLKLRIDGSVVIESTGGAYLITGFICKSGTVLLAEYFYDEDNEESWVEVGYLDNGSFVSYGALKHTKDGYGETLTGYKVGNNTFYGFESKDMRKRCTVRYYNNTFYYVFGLGLIDDNGLVTGEPVPYTEYSISTGTSTNLTPADTNAIRNVNIADTTGRTVYDYGNEEMENGSLRMDCRKDYFYSIAAGGYVPFTEPSWTAEYDETTYTEDPYIDFYNGKNYFGYQRFTDEEFVEHEIELGPSDGFDFTNDDNGYYYTLKDSYPLLFPCTNISTYYQVRIYYADLVSKWCRNALDAVKVMGGVISIDNTSDKVYANSLTYDIAYDDSTGYYTLSLKAIRNNSMTEWTKTITLTNSDSSFVLRVHSFKMFPLVKPSTGENFFFKTSSSENMFFVIGNNLANTQKDGTNKHKHGTTAFYDEATLDSGKPIFLKTPFYTVFHTGNTYIKATKHTLLNTDTPTSSLSYMTRLTCLSTGIQAQLVMMHDFTKNYNGHMCPKYELNYQQGIGVLEPEELEQSTGHPFVFSNRLFDKGLYWDYGRGWYKYHLVGYGIGKPEYSKNFYITSTALMDNAGNYYDADITKDFYDEDDTLQVDEKAFYDNLRWHEITEEKLTDDTILINHNFSGKESTYMALTSSFTLNTNYSLKVWNGIPLLFRCYNSLVWSPMDNGNEYSWNDAYLTRWSGNEIYYAKVGGDLKVSKIADYIFAVNVVDANNLIIENYNGSLLIQRYALPYAMDVTIRRLSDMSLPPDGTTQSNDVYYYGAGYNVFQNDDRYSTSVLLPSYTLQFYIASDDIEKMNYVINNRKAFLTASVADMLSDEYIDEFYTHSLNSTDITYKNTRYISLNDTTEDTYDTDLADTSWWLNEDVTLYPIGILTTIYGENYISPTVDAGAGYVSRLYVKDNKVMTSYNYASLVYQGSEIFTIMTSNYYFDGKSIYYLGNQSDYSQNVFTAYAMGMRFLANSSSEAYFYSKWDKCIYLFTASATLQKSTSLAGMGEIVDAAFSSNEQTLYILFEDGSLFCKTQDDSMVIETGVTNGTLQTTNDGCIVIDSEEGNYSSYNPHKYTENVNFELETEWLGNSDAVQYYPYFDIVLYDESMSSTPVLNATVSCLDSGVVKSYTEEINVLKTNWKNNFYRIRINPKELTGQAFKLKIESADLIHLFSMSVRVENASDVPTAQMERKAKW